MPSDDGVTYLYTKEGSSLKVRERHARDFLQSLNDSLIAGFWTPGLRENKSSMIHFSSSVTHMKQTPRRTGGALRDVTVEQIPT